MNNLPQRLFSSVGILPTNWLSDVCERIAMKLAAINFKGRFSLTLGWLKDGHRSILITRWSSLLEHPNETVQPRAAVTIVNKSGVCIMFCRNSKPVVQQCRSQTEQAGQIVPSLSLKWSHSRLRFHPQTESSNHLVQYSKQSNIKVLLNSFHLNGHTTDCMHRMKN